MHILETILDFLTTLARIIFPRRKRTVAGDDLCPCPLPRPSRPPLPVEGGNGGDDGGSRSDPLAPALRSETDTSSSARTSSRFEADWLGLSGYTLMLTGGAGWLYKVLIG